MVKKKTWQEFRKNGTSLVYKYNPSCIRMGDCRGS